MRRYRLNMALLLLAFGALSAGTVILFLKGLWAQGCLLFIAVAFAVWGIWNLQTKLVGMMSAFVNSLEMNDATVRIDAGGDPDLRRMSEAMNRIAELYSESVLNLETRKMYYDRILRIMTHEMRNGITPLIAIASDMERRPESYQGESLREAAALLYDQVKGIKHFLDSYYSLTHLPEPRLETVKAGLYFEGVRKLIGSELAVRNMNEDTVRYTIPEDMPLSIDAGLMNQVLLNLLRNAFDAVAGKEDGRVDVIMTVSETHPYLTITDNGTGMSDEVLENLFQPFYTTKEGGSGVGLTLCRQIVRKHGGELGIRSRQDKGTTVTIILKSA